MVAERAPGRRMYAKTRALADVALAVIKEVGPPVTVRQLMYQLFVRGYLPDTTDASYDKTERLTLLLRRNKELPYTDIVDRCRRVETHDGWDDLEDFMQDVQHSFRRNMWKTQATRVELWTEKDAMAAFVQPIASEYGCPLYVIRGYCSKSIMFDAATIYKQARKPTRVIYLGDHDPSGRDIERKIIADLEEFGAGDVATVERLFVDLEDIELFKLPSFKVRRGKSKSRQTFVNKFISTWGDTCAELDAVPPDIIREWLRETIEAEVNRSEWDAVKRIEAVENATLEMITRNVDRIKNGHAPLLREEG